MEEPRRLGGRYEIGAVLGRGGMAEVYLGRDIRLGRAVAVKTLRADLARDPTFQARFRREAQSAASLNHPAIVAVYDTGEDQDPVTGVTNPYIVMEYVDGSTLRELLHSGRRLLPERSLEMAAGVLQALEYSHRNGIIHRDIKPANVMLTRQGTVKVMDFGIARAMGDNSMTMTQTAAVIGTAQYLSPEQARGETVDARSDLYSAGCLLYELLTERPPFVGDSPVAVAYQHVREQPLPPSHFDPEVPPAIDAIVLKSLAKSADDRYQTADDMRADIERALSGQPVAAPVGGGMMMAGGYGDDSATQYLPPTAGGPPTGARPPQGPGTGQYNLDDDDYYDDPPKRRTASWILLAVACVAVIVAAVVIGKLLMGNDDKPKATIPKTLIGVTEADAQQALERLGLTYKKGTPDKVCKEAKGTVCETNPAVDTEVSKGDTVTVFFSSGPAKVKVPAGLVGMKEEDAKKAVEDAGLTWQADRSTEFKCTKDTVCSVNPTSGSELEPKGTVKAEVNSGKSTVSVPQVTGLTVEEAKSQITGAGLKVSTRESPHDTVGKGLVITQNPQAGAEIAKNTTVTLTISTGPAPASASSSPSNTTDPIGGLISGNTGSPSGTPSNSSGTTRGNGGGSNGGSNGGSPRGNQGDRGDEIDWPWNN